MSEQEADREEFADWFAWAYGGQEYADSHQSREHWLEVTDEFLSQPFMQRYTAEAEARGHARGAAEAAALRERVEGLAAVWDRYVGYRRPTDLATILRRVLDGE